MQDFNSLMKGMEYTDFGHQGMINSMDENLVHDDDINDLRPFLSELYSSNSSTCNVTEETSHQNTLVNPLPPPPPTTTPSCQILSFVNSHSLQDQFLNNIESSKNMYSSSEENYEIHASSGNGMASKRTPMQAQDHVLAERKRREKLSQLYIALSKVLPSIKKLDKASLLGDAINYMKELEERKRILEDEVRKTSEKVLCDEICSYKEKSTTCSNERRAEVKAKILDNNVLIKIHCKKQSGLASRIPCEMEKLSLAIHDMRIMPFGHTALDISILAEMQSEFYKTAETIVNALQLALQIPQGDMI